MTLRGMPWKVVVALVLVAAIFYSELVIEFAPDEVWGWLNTLLATFLSALLALAIGIWLFSMQSERAEKQRKQQLIKVLELEITNIMNNVVAASDPTVFTPVMTDTGNYTQVVLPEGLELITFDEAVRSGLFPKDVTVQLINLAGWIRAYNSRVRRTQSTLQAETMEAKKLRERGRGYLQDSTVEYLESGRKKVEAECQRML